MKTMKKNVAISAETEEKYKELVKRVRKGDELKENEKLLLFKLPNAPEVILEYVRRHKFPLGTRAVLKAFELPNAAEVFYWAVANWCWLTSEAQHKACKLQTAPDIFLMHAHYGREIDEDVQLKIFKLWNAQDILLEYSKKNSLCEKAQLKAFTLWDSEFFFHRYALNGAQICRKVQLKLLKLPHGLDILFTHCGQIFDDIQLKIFKLLPTEDAGRFFLKYVKESHVKPARYLCPQVQLKVFKLENAKEILQELAKHDYLCEEAQQKARELGYID